VGIVLGDFTLWGGLVVGLPLIFLSSLLFAALGFLAAAKSASIDAISYPQYIVVFPMFLFCGVFFPLTNLPIVFQYLAWAFPLTSFLSLFRSATLDLPWNFFAPLQLLGWFLLLLPWSYKAMQRRLVH
jgi:lipooligosaccharide transport system permease protein